ncbi:hypothetical protein [Desulfonatronum parangueonense]
MKYLIGKLEMLERQNNFYPRITQIDADLRNWSNYHAEFAQDGGHIPAGTLT